jgi:hypothetical protein
MENLIPTISKLQDIFATLQGTGSFAAGGGGVGEFGRLELPQIVVVGSQVYFLFTIWHQKGCLLNL